MQQQPLTDLNEKGIESQTQVAHQLGPHWAVAFQNAVPLLGLLAPDESASCKSQRYADVCLVALTAV